MKRGFTSICNAKSVPKVFSLCLVDLLSVVADIMAENGVL